MYVVGTTAMQETKLTAFVDFFKFILVMNLLFWALFLVSL